MEDARTHLRKIYNFTVNPQSTLINNKHLNFILHKICVAQTRFIFGTKQFFI